MGESIFMEGKGRAESGRKGKGSEGKERWFAGSVCDRYKYRDFNKSIIFYLIHTTDTQSIPKHFQALSVLK